MHTTTTLPHNLLTEPVRATLLAAAEAEIAKDADAATTWKGLVAEAQKIEGMTPEGADARAREQHPAEFMQYQLVAYCEKIRTLLSSPLTDAMPKITFPDVLLTDEVKQAIHDELLKHEDNADKGLVPLHLHHQQARERLSKIGVDAKLGMNKPA